MGLINRAVAAVWNLPRIFAAPRADPPDPSERLVYIGRSPAGIIVTPDEALKISAVWACCKVIAEAIAACRWEVIEEDTDGNRTVRRDVLLYRKLNVAPNPEMTAFAFRESALWQALLWGDFYAEIERSKRGDPMAIWPIDPGRVQLTRGNDWELVAEVSNSGGNVYIPYRDIFHLHGPSLTGLGGMSLIGYAARTFGHAAAAEIFGGAFYGNGTQLGGVLSTDGSLTEQQRTDLLRSINERHAGPDNAHKFLLLQGGLKFTPLSPTQEQSQFIETRGFLVEEICRWFSVPPHKIAHLVRSTFTNIEHQGLEFVRDTLTPWAERLRQEADLKLTSFGNRALRTRFDLAWLSEGDAASQADADSKYVSAGIRTRNEIRREHGWNALPEADGLTVQKQYVPLEEAARLAAAEADNAENPPRPVLSAPARDGDDETS